MIIGKFTNASEGLQGYITILSGDLDVNFVPAKGADFAVLTDNGCELGAAWRRVTRKGDKYPLRQARQSLPSHASELCDVHRRRRLSPGVDPSGRRGLTTPWGRPLTTLHFRCRKA
jgi:hypothetical protein